MSTRSVVGRIDSDTFVGRYHHTDGYPTALGEVFVERALAADDLEILGPFDAAGFNQSDGRVHIEASDAAVLAAAISLPSSLFR
ncbi:hypothetical protein LCGC14_3090460 [marine sediment metagenome]|uniref:Uncharacterized protein n=1 Tax=marine sediment metagenome TaxID=412755 RepID=A0A0F8WAS1_9ZZZZ